MTHFQVFKSQVNATSQIERLLITERKIERLERKTVSDNRRVEQQRKRQK